MLKIIRLEYNWKLQALILGGLLGRGMFTRCYKNPENNGEVILESTNSIKARYQYLNKMPHLPVITRIGETDHHTYYISPKYSKLTKSASASAWADYKSILKFIGAGSVALVAIDQDALEACDYIREPIKLALLELFGGMKHRGNDTHIEISTRNLKIDDSGNLILLDIVFSRDAVKAKRESQALKYAY